MTISRRGILKTVAAGAGFAATGGLGRAWAQGTGPIRIGYLLPLTGSQATYAPDCQLSAQIAVDQINQAGGVLGRTLELVVRDDKANANAAISAARELIGDGVNLFVGGLNTVSGLAVSGIMPEANGVFMSCGAIADTLTHEAFNRNYFRITDSSYVRCHAQARLAAERYPDVTRWGAMIPDAEFGHAVWKAFSHGLRQDYPQIAKKQPEISDPILFKYGAIDFKNQVASLMQLPVEAVYQSLTGEDFLTLLTQARPLGLTRKIKLFMDLSGELIYAKTLKKNLPETFWSASHWYYGSYLDNPIGKALYDEYVARTKDTHPTGYMGPPHMCLYAYANAIKAAGSTETAAVIGALEGMSFESCKGRITFRKEDHQAIGDVNLIKLGPKAEEPGWAVSDQVKLNSAAIAEPPSPGQPIRYA
ncbi:branched-chain amino acid ABC transporter substrate-binding protein [Alsobacter soli]|uniref:Branched-chain amino acid ABC transporter substrate-binding protein n=1 Tax=Alsobacter soli TaxID=2109933 RepID=A0A2T1HML8_9HYPH|nr:ABC transporter substrate-binding protein [Alsobacter soli]PSC02904.1 branched-chain amino acid ABC transporter substrate-binding protein [Alsobacter soli]